MRKCYDRAVRLVGVFLAALVTACGDSGLGSLSVASTHDIDQTGTPQSATTFSATFVVDGNASSAPQEIGPCTVLPPSGYHPHTSQRFVSAGTMDLYDGSQVTDVSFNQDLYTANLDLLAGGGSLDVKASGGDAPAFKSRIVVPSQVTITSPTKPPSGQLVFNPALDLPIAWSGGTDGDVSVYIAGMGIDTFPGGIACTFPAADGAGTVPAAALATLPSSGILGISSELASKIVVDSWTIDLAGYFGAVWPDGTGLSASYAVQ